MTKVFSGLYRIENSLALGVAKRRLHEFCADHCRAECERVEREGGGKFSASLSVVSSFDRRRRRWVKHLGCPLMELDPSNDRWASMGETCGVPQFSFEMESGAVEPDMVNDTVLGGLLP